jgi:hypothetical protein
MRILQARFIFVEQQFNSGSLLNRLIFITLFLFFPLSDIISQAAEQDKFVQVSGFITDAYNNPVRGVGIISLKLRRATISEWSGIYSITSIPGDTILFRALGYKKYHTVIPLTFNDKYCSADIVLETDTIQIAEVKIFPWKTYAEFLKDMTKEKVKDPIIENMNDNIASIYVAIAKNTGGKVSPETGYKYAMEQNFNSLATRNQVPSLSLLNPFAWAKFISGLKNGLFKNQKFDKPVKARIKKKNKNNKQK